MKHLNKFNEFWFYKDNENYFKDTSGELKSIEFLNEELKYSKLTYEKILNSYRICSEKVKKERGGNKSRICMNHQESSVITVDSLLYDSFEIKIGANFLQYCIDNDFNIDDIKSDIMRSVTSREVKIPKKIEDCKVLVTFEPFYRDMEYKNKNVYINMADNLKEKLFKETFLETGNEKALEGLSGYCLFEKPLVVKENGYICQFIIGINTHELLTTDIVKNTIRHELQHMTQYLNSFCLDIGQKIIKNRGEISKPKDFILDSYYKTSKNPGKVGGGKTKIPTKLPVNEFDPKTGDKLKNDEIEFKRMLNYLSDNAEYKPWITDKVEFGIENWINKNPKNIDSLKPFNVENVIGDIFNSLIKDPDIKMIKSVRKETDKDIINLLRKKLLNKLI